MACFSVSRMSELFSGFSGLNIQSALRIFVISAGGEAARCVTTGAVKFSSSVLGKELFSGASAS